MISEQENYLPEFWGGLGTELTLLGLGHMTPAWRDDTKTMFLYGSLGLITAQKIEALEFDGWEIFVGFHNIIRRFEDAQDAQLWIRQTLLEAQKEEA